MFGLQALAAMGYPGHPSSIQQDVVVNLCVQSNSQIPYSIRLFGLVGIIYTDCSSPLALHVRPYMDWPQCASPAVILALYWLLATETRFYFIKVRTQLRESHLAYTEYK